MDYAKVAELRELVRAGGSTSAYRDGLREALDQIEEQAAELRRMQDHLDGIEEVRQLTKPGTPGP